MRERQEQKDRTASNLSKDLGMYKFATKKAYDYQRQRLIDAAKSPEENKEEVN